MYSLPFAAEEFSNKRSLDRTVLAVKKNNSGHCHALGRETEGNVTLERILSLSYASAAVLAAH
jgi:hypothetical protein